jgi:putative ABC transport system substrate-binding protein
MRRREFLGGLGTAAAWPLSAYAQRSAGELPKVGTIFTAQSENTEAFVQGLRDAGYVDGATMALEARLYGSDPGRLDEAVRDLIALNCKVILASNPYVIRAVVKATSTIPIVGVDLESDPVASGFAKSVARPGGNLTGFFLDIPELGGKQIELLMEVVPDVSRLAVLWDATIGAVQFRATEMAPRPAGLALQSKPIRRVEDINEAFESALREQTQGLIVLSSPLIFLQRAHIADLALKTRLPAINLFNSFPKVGGLMAYGPDFPSIYRQAAGYVGRILAGANPGDLPIQRPDRFDLVINLKTAKSLGITVPPNLLARADEVIE